MDSDSAYITFSSKNLNDIVKPELQEHFEQNKHKWLIGNAEHILKKKCYLISALSSKMYHCIGGKKRLSYKRINQKQIKMAEALYRQGKPSHVIISVTFLGYVCTSHMTYYKCVFIFLSFITKSLLEIILFFGVQ